MREAPREHVIESEWALTLVVQVPGDVIDMARERDAEQPRSD
jgi:hypothetical protein